MFQMNMSDYQQFNITEDGRLCSMGQHRPEFPRVLYDALLHLGYNGDVPVYHARMSMAHGLDQCEVSVTIPLNPAEPWMAIVINVKLDGTSHPHLLMWELPHRHRCDANHALSDSLSGRPHVAAVTLGHIRPQGPALPCRHGRDVRVCTILIQPAAHHH
jgi:hypothetical protein